MACPKKSIGVSPERIFREMNVPVDSESLGSPDYMADLEYRVWGLLNDGY